MNLWELLLSDLALVPRASLLLHTSSRRNYHSSVQAVSIHACCFFLTRTSNQIIKPCAHSRANSPSSKSNDFKRAYFFNL